MTKPGKSLKLKGRKNLEYANGTKSISPQVADSLYDSLQWRIERERSVALWSYKRKDNEVRIKILFNDQETSLDINVDSFNIPELMKAIETVDAYLMAKRQRS